MGGKVCGWCLSARRAMMARSGVHVRHVWCGERVVIYSFSNRVMVPKVHFYCTHAVSAEREGFLPALVVYAKELAGVAQRRDADGTHRHTCQQGEPGLVLIRQDY